MKTFAMLLPLVLLASASHHVAAQVSPGPPGRASALPAQATGEDVYRAACITCHGEDGTGSAREVIGPSVSPPDFSDCAFATGEPDPDWYAVVHEGGPIRALDRHMPAFGEALSPDEISLAISHIRTFCSDTAWPRGDLNFPRAFFTEKAFPENEAVWATTIGTGGFVGNEIVYERRIGPRNQFEIVVPIDFVDAPGGGRSRGLGDVALAFKRAVYSSVETGRIASAGAEIIFPTGKEALGLGNGYAVFEPFAMWGQALPRSSFLQMHGGVELPVNSTAGSAEVFVRTSVGTSLAQDRGFGRAWSPQVEVLWARAAGGSSDWDLVPQLQVTLSKLQHVMAAGGVRVPLNHREQRSTQALFYLLWDWYDGSPFDFWK